MKILRLWTSVLAILLAFGLATLKVLGQSLPAPYRGSFMNQIAQFASSDPLTLGYTGCGGVTAPEVREDYEQQVVELVNKIRVAEGLPPLKQASALVEAARYHARDMIMDGYIEHDSFDWISSQLVKVCFWYERVTTYYFPSWRALSENIAVGQADPEWVVQDWMNSPGHRRNILSLETWEIGVGYASGGDFSHYWVQDFGRREGVYPIVINNEAAVTETRAVDLYIYGDWQEMRLRNDAGAWGNWQPFRINIQSSDSQQVLDWSAILVGEWFQASPSSGVTPQTLTIWPQNPTVLSPGMYTGTLTLIASGPGEGGDSIQSIELRLQVIDGLIRPIFLPLAVQSD